jgi:NADPH-dependent 2,4-dienoyl-CoA reductase/sulfur reductase-like enzyme
VPTLDVQTDVLIVGAGPAGLAAAVELRRLGVGKVLVADREGKAGGIPRHCDHIGFGVRDLRRFMSGPAYARRYVQLAEKHCVDIRTETTITGWQNGTSLTATSPAGLATIQARAVVLATGSRERPRAARLVPGSRPQGVFTTGSLQNFVYVRHLPVGQRAVVIGAEHVSFSAVMTLKHAGADVAAMVTDLPRYQSFLQYRLVSADRYRVPIYTNMKITRIIGKPRVEAVELTHMLDGSIREIECDTVVFTGDWIPDYELAFYGGLALHTRSKLPQVNQRLQTSAKGVFAAGNLVHPAETADIAALSGRHVARSVTDYLGTGAWPADPSMPIEFGEPIYWISPGALVPGERAPLGRFMLRVTKLLPRSTIEVWQGDRRLWRQRCRQLVPNLPVYVSDRWLKDFRESGEPVRFDVR